MTSGKSLTPVISPTNHIVITPKHHLGVNALLGGSIDGKIVHEDLHNLLIETMKYSRHTSLKSSRCITQTKRHMPISISTIRKSESCLLLISSINMNLREARIPIKITKVSIFFITSQAFDQLKVTGSVPS